MLKFRGVTLLEVIISIGIFSFLITVIFYIFSISSRSWLKARETVDVRESAQLLISRIERELRVSSIFTVETIEYPHGTGREAISFLSAYDAEGKAGYDASGYIKWKKYFIFYLTDDPKVVPDGYYQFWSRNVSLGEFVDHPDEVDFDILSTMRYPPLLTTSPTSTNSMSKYINGTVVPLAYLSDPRPITRNITDLAFNIDTDRKKLEILVKIGKPSNPSDIASGKAPERLEFKGVVVLRN